MRRLTVDELFPGGRLEPIGDETLTRRLNEVESRALRGQSCPGYRDAITEELLQMPEAVANEGKST